MKSVWLLVGFCIGFAFAALITTLVIAQNIKNYNSTGIYFSDDVCAEVIEMNEGVN